MHYLNYLGNKIMQDGLSKDDIINSIVQAKKASKIKKIY